MKMEEHVAEILEAIAPGITVGVTAYIASRALRWLGQEPSEEEIVAMSEEVGDALDLSAFDELIAPTEEALGEIGVAASNVIADQAAEAVAAANDAGGVSVSVSVGRAGAVEAMFNQVHTDALAYAKERAAEMVGKRWEGGLLVDNPNANMAITETTRNKIKELVVRALSPATPEPFDLKTALEELTDEVTGSPLFSRARAGLIAQAEVGMAQALGTLNSLRAMQKITGLVIFKRWSTAHDGKVCHTLCLENAAAGPIPLNEVFPSGDLAPLAHPRCRCSLVGVPQKQSTSTPQKELTQ